LLQTALRDVPHGKVYSIQSKPLPCGLSALGEAVLYLWIPKYIGPRGSHSERIESVVSLLVLAHLKAWIDSARSSEMGMNLSHYNSKEVLDRSFYYRFPSLVKML
jgi:hypothetical protein